jgi:outer membrane protein assembly factor BamB
MRPTFILSILLVPAAALIASNWTTAGHDPQRTGWSPQETDINPGNVKSMGLLWKTHLDNEPRELNSLSQAVVVEWVPTDKGMREYAIVAGASDHLYALNPDTGKIVWQKSFANPDKPKQKPFWLCPNALNATPLIRKQGLAASVYTISSDGKLHVFNVIDGEDRMPPMQFVPEFSKNWSLNIDGDTIYTNTSQGCGGAKSGVWAMDLKSPDHKVSFFASTGGVWGRSGVALSSNGTIFAGTGDGAYDAAQGKFPDTILQLSPKEAQLVDYFTPTNHNYLTRKDLDMGSLSPLVFTLQGREIVAAGGKEGVVYLLDAKGIGGGDHKTPLYRSPVLVNEEADFAGKGFWGAFATAEDESKNRWLYAPALGAAAAGVKWPNANGDAPNGSIMALRVEEKDGKPVATPAWISRDMNLPEPPIVAGGLVFAISNGEFARQSKGDGALFTSAERIAKHAGNTVLYAFDMTTGKQLFSSGDTMPSWTHFSGISISGGRVYVTTFDSTVYAFGIKE